MVLMVVTLGTLACSFMSFHLRQSTEPGLKDLIAKQTREIQELRREVQQLSVVVVKTVDSVEYSFREIPQQMKLNGQPPLEQKTRSEVLETAVPVSQKQVAAAGEGFRVTDLAYRWCAAEGELCKCDGFVRYGVAGKWSAVRNGTEGQLCSNEAFGDAAPGREKHCECTDKSLMAPELHQAMLRLEKEQSEQAARSDIAEMQVTVDPASLEAAVKAALAVIQLPVADRTHEHLQTVERAVRLLQTLPRGREAPRSKFFAGSNLIACFFGVRALQNRF